MAITTFAEEVLNNEESRLNIEPISQYNIESQKPIIRKARLIGGLGGVGGGVGIVGGVGLVGGLAGLGGLGGLGGIGGPGKLLNIYFAFINVINW